MRFLGSDLRLEKLGFDNVMTEEDRVRNNEIWRERPSEMVPTRNDFRAAAEQTRINGVLVEKKREEPPDGCVPSLAESELLQL